MADKSLVENLMEKINFDASQFIPIAFGFFAATSMWMVVNLIPNYDMPKMASAILLVISGFVLRGLTKSVRTNSTIEKSSRGDKVYETQAKEK